MTTYDITPTEIEKLKDDFVKTIFLWANRKVNNIKDNELYPRYFPDLYGLTNPKMYHVKMISEGYFKYPSIDEILNSYTLIRLKEIAKSKAIKVSSKKNDLISKLLFEMDDNEKKRIVDSSLGFLISKKGIQFIDNHSDYILLHKHQNWKISIDEYLAECATQTDKNDFYKISYLIITKELKKYRNTKEYGVVRNLFLTLSEIMKCRKKERESLHYLLIVFYLDLSGITTYWSVFFQYSHGMYSVSYLKEHFYPNRINRGLVPRIIALSAYYYESIVDDIYSSFRLPFSLCEKEVFKSFVNDCLSLPQIDEGKYNKIFRTKYNAYLDKLS